MDRHPPTPPQDGSVGHHTTVLHTETAPTKITVELASDGRWFKVLHDLVRSGVWGGLTLTQKAILIPLHAHRQEDGLMVESIESIGREAGLGRSATYEAITGLLAHPAGLLARRGSAFVVMPEHPFAGRQSAAADPPVRHGGKHSAAADGASVERVRPRAPNQPAKDRETNTSEGSSSSRLVGWQGIGLFWDPRSAGSPDELLRALRLSGRLLETTAALPGITVDEIAAEAERVAQDRSVTNHPACLAHRLAAARGGAKPRPAASTDPELAALYDKFHRIRLAKAGSNLTPPATTRRDP